MFSGCAAPRLVGWGGLGWRALAPPPSGVQGGASGTREFQSIRTLKTISKNASFIENVAENFSKKRQKSFKLNIIDLATTSTCVFRYLIVLVKNNFISIRNIIIND